MKNTYNVFHSSCAQVKKQISIILVRPQESGNVGSIARALANMGIEGSFNIVGSPQIITSESQKFAKHAKDRLEKVLFFESLAECLAAAAHGQKKILSLAATARIGSANRPHPLRVRKAMQRATQRLISNESEELLFVFGPEGSGLTNEEIQLCDWVVTIPSTNDYRSLNLAQSVLIFCYEANMALLDEWEEPKFSKPNSRAKLVHHLLQIAEEVGFVLPGDPFKMRPRLEEIFSQLPNHIKEMKTLHGLLDQISRSVKRGIPDFKGRYRVQIEKAKEVPNGK